MINHMHAARRVVVVVAVVALAAQLSGCGSSTNASSTSGTIRVVALASGVSGTQSPVALLVHDFEAANPKIKVKLSTLPFNQYAQVIRAQINAGSPPDVIQTTSGYGNAIAVNELARANALLDLSGEPWVGEIPSQFRDVFGTNHKIYNYAPTKSAIGLIYDKTSFAAKHLDVPKTFPELIDLCRREAGSGKSLLALGGQATVNLLFVGYALAASTAYSQDPQFPAERLADKTKFSDSKGWLESLQEFDVMNQAKCFGDSPAGLSTDAATQRLAKGSALATISVLESLPVVQTAATKGDWAVAPFPGGSDEAATRVPIGVSAGFAVPSKAKQSILAKRFISFLATPANTARFATNSKSIPLFTAGATESTVPSAAQALAPYLAPARSVTYLDQYWPSAEVEQNYMKDLQSLVTGQIAPDAILRDMDQSWQGA